MSALALPARVVNSSAGVANPKVLRGRSLSCRATLLSWACEYTDRSVPFGKYCRSRPLVFSLEPRCHGLADRRSKRRCWSPTSSADGPQAPCRGPRSATAEKPGHAWSASAGRRMTLGGIAAGAAANRSHAREPKFCGRVAPNEVASSTGNSGMPTNEAGGRAGTKR